MNAGVCQSLGGAVALWHVLGRWPLAPRLVGSSPPPSLQLAAVLVLNRYPRLVHICAAGPCGARTLHGKGSASAELSPQSSILCACSGRCPIDPAQLTLSFVRNPGRCRPSWPCTPLPALRLCVRLVRLMIPSWHCHLVDWCSGSSKGPKRISGTTHASLPAAAGHPFG